MHKKLIFICGVLYCYSTLPTHIAIIGCGYVGLTCTAVLLNTGHTVTCIDTDSLKIASLYNKQLPFYEPGLAELLFDPAHASRCAFISSLTPHLHPDIYYICVPTPMAEDGSCDCSYLYTALTSIEEVIPIDQSALICIKSTVPPGTMHTLRDSLRSTFQLIYNPEFMREGCALNDIYTRNPIVIGGEVTTSTNLIEALWRHVLPHAQIITTNFETAELIKYAWNSFSAMRIAYINELARICRTIQADISTIVRALACSEELLPTKDLKPGPGYGGSCLPKDTTAFAHILSSYNFDSSLVHCTIESNKTHREQLINDICSLIKNTRRPQTITLLGLSFKANTDDIRNAPALEIIPALIHRGITVKVYDPKAMPAMQRIFPHIIYGTDPYDAIQNSDGIVILTEWEEFKGLDLSHIARLCHTPRIIDTRNVFTPATLKAHGFEYLTMGSL